MRRHVAAVAAALCLVVGAPACSGGEDDPEAAPGPATETTGPGSCPTLSVAAGANEPSGPEAEATDAPGDFDGDGGVDRLLTYRTAAGGPWRIRMELARGGGAEAELPATAEGVKAVGGYRLDVGPSEAAFAVVGRDPAGVNLGLFVLRGCRLERVTLDGAPAELPVGTAPTGRSGVACQAPGLVALHAPATDGPFVQGSSVAYLLVGEVLDEANRSTATLGAEDPQLGRYGTFTCGALSL